jgi:hypothetical protein
MEMPKKTGLYLLRRGNCAPIDRMLKLQVVPMDDIFQYIRHFAADWRKAWYPAVILLSVPGALAAGTHHWGVWTVCISAQVGALVMLWLSE